jgi:hypothetical protein
MALENSSGYVLAQSLPWPYFILYTKDTYLSLPYASYCSKYFIKNISFKSQQ